MSDAMQLQKTVENLRKVLELNSIINSTLNLEELLGILMKTAEQVMNSQVASLMLVDEKSHDLIFKVALGEKGGELKEKFRIRMGEGIAGSVAESGNSLIVNDVQNDARFAKRFDDSTGFQTKAILCVPMKAKGKVIGVLQAINPVGRDTFSANDQALFETFADQAAIAIENAQLHGEIVKQERTKQDLKIAHEIQQNFLPDLTGTSFGLDVAAQNIPALAVGGDFYDVIKLDENKTGIVIGDVSGKGVPAALYMVRAISEYRFLAPKAKDPAELVTTLNNTLAPNSPFGMFVTLFYMVVDHSRKTLHYTSAGHHPLIKREHPTGKVEELDNTGGPPVGLSQGVEYGQSSHEAKPGDAFFTYTDGIVEARNEKAEEYGTDRLKKCVSQKNNSAKDEASQILDDVKLFAKEAAQHDDITVIAMRLNES